ncbi:hypothetical protein [Microvirga mediterraneensis]|uniref:Uncharacterized protein n=1 Tax=Microvirga mediterraneensis TaxID=2754695 RepID=A0A838BT00_9HYPH|nr:hypothetical protein [Microvirga mediterraneensis]MBA1158677.1 hypothetical protein [Microvirga mediterraneensis]
MMTPEQKLIKVRGQAPEKRPSVRVLSAATSHSDCAFAMVALAARADLDKLCDGTDFEVAFGQDPQAFQRGEMFERRVKEPNYGTLIQLLRDKAGFPLTSVRVEDLRSRTPPNTAGLKQRAAETKRILRLIARNAATAPNIIDGAVLTCEIAGQTAYFEADSLAAAANGKLHVVEVKSFPITDARCDPDKLGAAVDQAAWYALLCRRTLADEGLSADIVSSEGFIIVADGVGLTPTLLRQPMEARIRRAERLLATLPKPAEILSRLPEGVELPAVALDPDLRLIVLEKLLDIVGTSYTPSCLQDCGMARLCRSRAHTSGLPVLCGGPVVRQLPGVHSLTRAIELSTGAPPGPAEVHAADALARAAAAYDRVLKGGGL